MTPILLEGPAGEPLSLAETKLWLRLDDDTEDATITALISSARMLVERLTGKVMITQTFRLIRDAWPDCGEIVLPRTPVQSVAAIAVETASAVPVVLSADQYRLENYRDPPIIRMLGLPISPTIRHGGILIDLVCGYGATADTVPEPLRQAMRLMIAHWFENRGDDAKAGALPSEVQALIGSFRRPRL